MAASKVTLPKGFTSIGGMGESWKPTKKGASIQGVLIAVKNIKKKAPKKGENPMMKLATIRTTDGGEVQVWESSRLRALFTVKKGTKVFVRFEGIGKAAKKGQNPPRLYTVATSK